jgi:hypothetical protein
MRRLFAGLLATLMPCATLAQGCNTPGCQYTVFTGHSTPPPRAALPSECQYTGTVPQNGANYSTFAMQGSPLTPVLIKAWTVVTDKYPASNVHASCLAAPLLGERNGSATDSAPNGVTRIATFTAWLGTAPTYATDYAWSGRTMTAATVERSVNLVASAWYNAGFANLVIGLPLITGSDGGNLAAAAAPGNAAAYAAEFSAMAANLIAAGFPNATIRLGWEFNGGWEAWYSGADPTDFIALWQAAVTAMRSVPGAAFKFDWNPSLSAGNPEPSYPGDAYVDFIGGDIYNKNLGTVAGCTTNFCNLQNLPYGLNWQVAFAAAHGKFVSYPEWGVWVGGIGLGDDPDFVSHMTAWIAAHNTAYAAVWNQGAQEMDIPTTQVPNSAAAYKAAYAPGG